MRDKFPYCFLPKVEMLVKKMSFWSWLPQRRNVIPLTCTVTGLSLIATVWFYNSPASEANALPDMSFYCKGVACYEPSGEYLGTVREIAEKQDPDGRLLDLVSNHEYVNTLVSRVSHDAIYGPPSNCDDLECRDHLAYEQFMVQSKMYNELYENVTVNGTDILNNPLAMETVLRDATPLLP